MTDPASNSESADSAKIPKNSVQPGTVTAGADIGKIEGSILAKYAIDDVASDIAQSIHSAAKDGVILWPGTKAPTFANLESFEYRKQRLTALFNKAAKAFQLVNDDYKRSRSQVARMAAGPTGAVALVGTLLENAANIASYFKTNLTFNKVTTEGVDDDLLVAATAGSLIARGVPVLDPSKAITAHASRSIAVAVQGLNAQRSIASDHKEQCAKALVDLEGKTSASDLAFIAQFERVTEMITAVEEALDSFTLSLAGETDGVALVAQIAKEHALRSMIDKNGLPILYLHVHTHGGGNVTRQSLWSFLGLVRPFKITGGVVASFTLAEKDGRVLMADSMSRYSGYNAPETVRRSAFHRARITEDRRAALSGPEYQKS